MANRGKKHPNFLDIARQAGVSPSTVDRVLNERDSVSDEKRRRVLEAARQLGARRILPPAGHGQLHFDVILAASDSGHFSQVERWLLHYASLFSSRITLHLHSWDGDLRKLLALLGPRRYRRHGLALVAPDAAEVRAALSRIVADGVATILLSSNIDGLAGTRYVGIDNEAAGRTAAFLMGKFLRRGDRVLLLTNSVRYLAHRQRVDGFLEVLRRDFPGIKVEGPVECLDQATRCWRAVTRAVQNSPRLRGIYNTGAGSNGIGQALAKLANRPQWITHEASPEHLALLESRLMTVAIDQDPEGQALACLQHLLYANHEIAQAPTRQPRFQLFTAENLA
jgi:LacI family transcriptional regulator